MHCDRSHGCNKSAYTMTISIAARYSRDLIISVGVALANNNVRIDNCQDEYRDKRARARILTLAILLSRFFADRRVCLYHANVVQRSFYVGDELTCPDFRKNPDSVKRARTRWLTRLFSRTTIE